MLNREFDRLPSRITTKLNLSIDLLQWETIGGVLALADYFGAGGVLSRADAWLCRQCRGGSAEPSRSCAAFEFAARHRLGGAMALLLPFAVQCMARGSRCTSIW